MPGRLLNPNPREALSQSLTGLPAIFNQAQQSQTNHKKNFVALWKLHSEAAECTEIVRQGRGRKLVGERMFEDSFIRMLLRVLPLKKGVGEADRVIKFVGGYIRFLNERASEEPLDADDDEETHASRFTAHLLEHLMNGFVAKDKNVRYRVLSTVAEMVSHLGEIDEEIYNSLKAGLLERLKDRESSVRVQATIALSKLCGAEDSEADDGQTVVELLLDMLAHDTSADVRRAVLHNIPINTDTLPSILARTRDTDTSIRKAVYASVLKPNTTQGEPESKTMGPTHPRVLTIAQRELIVKHGLGDREESVRLVVGSLISSWVDVVNVKAEPVETKIEDDVAQEEKMKTGVLSLLKLFDLSEGIIATDALLSVFTTRADIVRNLEFGDNYWRDLTPETAFLARVFVDYCKTTQDEAKLEMSLPVVTALAFHIQESYNKLLEYDRNDEEERLLRDINEDEQAKREENRINKESVIGEMLKLAVNLDYSDEIGRRKMFQLVRDMLSQESLPQSLLPCCLDVLRQLSSGERDLIRVVVEIVNDLRDNNDFEEAPKDVDDADTSFGQTPPTVKAPRQRPAEVLSPEERARRCEVDLRCLSLCIGMLERVISTFEENSTLQGVLNDLIVPSVRSSVVALREKGLVAMGLCCLIDRRLACNSIKDIFGHVFNNAHPEILRASLVQTVFDILMVHERVFLKEKKKVEEYTSYFMRLLGSDIEDKVLALVSMGIAKLILSGMITDDVAVINLVKAYMSPETKDNQELRQCLAFFFHTYCQSSLVNQQTMQRIFIDTFASLSDDRKMLEEGQEMVESAQVAAMFVDWTDPSNLKKFADVRERANEKNCDHDEGVHLDMADCILWALCDKRKDDRAICLSKEDKKALVNVLNKLRLPENADDVQIRRLKLIIDKLRLRRPLPDATSNRVLLKFDTMIQEKYAKQLENFDEDELRKLEDLQEFFKDLDDIMPLDDSEVIDIDAPKKGRKRRSSSITSTTTNNDRSSKSHSKAKKRRLSTSDDEDDDEDAQHGTPPAPIRTLPKRAATKIPREVIMISSDDEDDDDDDDTPGPRVKKPKPTARRQKEMKQEELLDAEINDLLSDDDSREVEPDSIMDSEPDEEDEEEVSELLAGV